MAVWLPTVNPNELILSVWGNDVRKLPAGLAGYSALVADSGGYGATAAASTLTVTVTVPAGRRIRLNALLMINHSAGGPSHERCEIREGGTVLADAAQITTTSPAVTNIVAERILTPAAGAHTYQVWVRTDIGTSVIVGNAAEPSHLVVEDLGGSMTAAGDAVLAVARGEIGYAEGPGNSTKYWDWYGANYGAWCACFVSWCCEMAGFPMCPIDSSKGFILVSNGTAHSYEGWEVSQEAQPTVQLEPGDVVLFSWESWVWSGGVPVCAYPPYQGWTAGDHTGIVSIPPDAAGWFSAVEGNTSSLSYDNGGEVRERSDRHISQVCGWWRPRNYGEAGGGVGPPTAPTYNLTELGMFLLNNTRRGTWLMGPGYARGLDQEEYSQVSGIPGIGMFDCGDNERAFDLVYSACMNGATAVENQVRTIAVGCLAADHGHVFLARRRPLDRDDRPGVDALLTLWICPALRAIGAIIEDPSRDPATLTPGGPLW